MEGILAIAAIIIFIVRAIKASENKQKNQNERPRTPPQRPVASGEIFDQFKRFEEMFSDNDEKSFEGVNRPNAEGYMQNEKKESTGYSKGFSRAEAFAHTEGTESFEGKCVEPDANHCAVEHSEDSVYATEITDEVAAFSKDDIVKGIIMAEILSKPKCME